MEHGLGTVEEGRIQDAPVLVVWTSVQIVVPVTEEKGAQETLKV